MAAPSHWADTYWAETYWLENYWIGGVAVEPEPEPPRHGHTRGRRRPYRVHRPEPQEPVVALQLFDARREGEFRFVLQLGATVRIRRVAEVGTRYAYALAMEPRLRARRLAALDGRLALPALRLGGSLDLYDGEPMLLAIDDDVEVEA